MATVDTGIYGHASGAAADLAAAHSAEHPLKLYGGWFCPFVQRVWIVLEEKDIAHQYIEINPYRKDPDFVALNPRGLVPTLAVPVSIVSVEGLDADNSDNSVLDRLETATTTKPLYESTVICEFLEDAFPDRPPKLLPTHPYERARARLWIDHICTRIVPAFYKLLQHTPDKTYTLDEARAELHAHLKAFVEAMAPDSGPSEGGSWFLGDRFSMVDVMLAPWAMRLWLIDRYKAGGVGIPPAGDEAVWGRWERWFEQVIGRESVRRTMSDEERYLQVYQRYAEDTTQSEVGKATRAGKKILP